MDSPKVQQVQKKRAELVEEKLNTSIAELSLEDMAQAAAGKKRETNLEKVTTRMKVHDDHVAEVHTRHRKFFDEAEAVNSAELKLKLEKENQRLERQQQDRTRQLVDQKQKLADHLAKVELHHKELENQTKAARAACQSALDKSLTAADKLRHQHLLNMVEKLKKHDIHVSEVRERHEALCAGHKVELKRDQEHHDIEFQKVRERHEEQCADHEAEMRKELEQTEKWSQENIEAKEELKKVEDQHKRRSRENVRAKKELKRDETSFERRSRKKAEGEFRRIREQHERMSRETAGKGCAEKGWMAEMEQDEGSKDWVNTRAEEKGFMNKHIGEEEEGWMNKRMEEKGSKGCMNKTR